MSVFIFREHDIVDLDPPMSEPCDHSNWYPYLAKQPCHCGRPGCTRTDTGTSNDTCPHWFEDRVQSIYEEMLRVFKEQPMSDPILAKLDAILSKRDSSAVSTRDLRDKLRALLAEVAIEYYGEGKLDGDAHMHSRDPDEIRKRFGVAPPSEKEKT
jgi:hypothetical protein